MSRCLFDSVLCGSLKWFKWMVIQLCFCLDWITDCDVIECRLFYLKCMVGILHLKNRAGCSVYWGFPLRGELQYDQFWTYKSNPSAGPPCSTSDTMIDVSPFSTLGLSRPPDTAIPKPILESWRKINLLVNTYIKTYFFHLCQLLKTQN